MPWSVTFFAAITSEKTLDLTHFLMWMLEHRTTLQQCVGTYYKFDVHDELSTSVTLLTDLPRSILNQMYLFGDEGEKSILRFTLTHAGEHTAKFLFAALRAYLKNQLNHLYVFMSGDFEARTYLGKRINIVYAHSRGQDKAYIAESGFDLNELL